jgi:hypothetical protein
MSNDNWRPGPETERAYGFNIAFCGDPNCGLHIVPHNKDDKPICEIVMSYNQTLALIQSCQDGLYAKVADQ